MRYDPLLHGDPAAHVDDDELPAGDVLDVACAPPGCGGAEGEPCGPPCVPANDEELYDLDGFGQVYSDADPGL